MTESKAMSSTSENSASGHTADPTAREHSENAAEGGEGQDIAEIRMHSQEAAEGPDED